MQFVGSNTPWFAPAFLQRDEDASNNSPFKTLSMRSAVLSLTVLSACAAPHQKEGASGVNGPAPSAPAIHAAPSNERGQDTQSAPADLSISTWNLGYAGLGADSDFKTDGGTHYLPPSRKVVDRNLRDILETASGLQTDVQFFQEVANNSPLSYGRNLTANLRTTLAREFFWFKPEISPRLLATRHGTAIATNLPVSDTQNIAIIGEESPMFGLINRHYALQVVRIPAKDARGDWVLINIHLSAFDDGGKLRRAQIDAVFDYAQTQYAKGARVVIGGDWNMELTPSTFPHQTADEHLFWIHPFPTAQLPDGWHIAIDRALPTVRTMHKPYVAGENYVTIIDGFITSPNVKVISVQTTDTGFQMSDHMPVIATFRAAN